MDSTFKLQSVSHLLFFDVFSEFDVQCSIFIEYFREKSILEPLEVIFIQQMNIWEHPIL